MAKIQQLIVITDIDSAVKVLKAVQDLLKKVIKDGMTRAPWNRGYCQEMVRHFDKHVVEHGDYDGFALDRYEGDSLVLFPVLVEGVSKMVDDLLREWGTVGNGENLSGYDKGVHDTTKYTLIYRADELQRLLDPKVVEELIKG